MKTLAAILYRLMQAGGVALYVFCLMWIPDLYIWAKKTSGHGERDDSYMADDLLPWRVGRDSRR